VYFYDKALSEGCSKNAECGVRSVKNSKKKIVNMQRKIQNKIKLKNELKE